MSQITNGYVLCISRWLLIVFIRLILSLSLCPKVITLTSFNCIYNWWKYVHKILQTLLKVTRCFVWMGQLIFRWKLNLPSCIIRRLYSEDVNVNHWSEFLIMSSFTLTVNKFEWELKLQTRMWKFNVQQYLYRCKYHKHVWRTKHAKKLGTIMAIKYLRLIKYDCVDCKHLIWKQIV
jgi:hypothetical protein